MIIGLSFVSLWALLAIPVLLLVRIYKAIGRGHILRFLHPARFLTIFAIFVVADLAQFLGILSWFWYDILIKERK